MPNPTNCQHCRTVVYRPEDVTIRTCQRCWHEKIADTIKTLNFWSRRSFRRTLQIQREREGWAWEV
jgi:hypothetical protein